MAVHPGSIWLERNWDPSKLPDGHWVAANAGGLIEYSIDLDDLYKIIISVGVSFDDVAIAFVWFGDIQ